MSEQELMAAIAGANELVTIVKSQRVEIARLVAALATSERLRLEDATSHIDEINRLKDDVEHRGQIASSYALQIGLLKSQTPYCCEWWMGHLCKRRRGHTGEHES